MAASTLDALKELRRRIGTLVREEVAEGDRSICYYTYTDIDEALPFMCELGCCKRACCAAGERASEYTTYAWALVLLVIVLVTIIASLVALLFVYYINKRKTAELRRRLAYSHATDSSNVSQISVPASYYYPEGYYQYTAKDCHSF